MERGLFATFTTDLAIATTEMCDLLEADARLLFRSSATHSPVCDACEFCDVSFPRREVTQLERREPIVPAGPSEDAHEFDGGVEIVGEPPSRLLHDESRP